MSAPVIVVSPSSQVRRARVLAWLGALSPAADAYLVGASRESVADVLRESLGRDGARMGTQTLSFTQLALRLSEPSLATRGLAPAGALTTEAVAARAAFEQARQPVPGYFGPVLGLPGLPAALASTLSELRVAGVSGEALAAQQAPAGDLGTLLEEYERQLDRASLADRGDLLRTARLAVLGAGGPLDGSLIALLDVPVQTDAELLLVRALAEVAGSLLLTVPAGDERSLALLTRDGWTTSFAPAPAAPSGTGSSGAARLARYLFSAEDPPEAEWDDTVQVFSAPGEGREATEIARRLLEEAGRGVRFDEMAILVRAPDAYAGLLDHALRRAGIPAYFSRGTRRPDPTGRAFLAMLACAAEDMSARRFAEYLSLGQLPRLDADGTAPSRSIWQASEDEVLGARGLPAEKPRESAPVALRLPFDDEDAADAAAHEATEREREHAAKDAVDAAHGAAVYGTLRAPRQWEALLVESAVIKGPERWARRLAGLSHEYDVRIAEAARDDADAPLVAGLRRARVQLEHLRRFALPLVQALAELPHAATWGEWLQALGELAPRVLGRPERVLAVLADMRPMAAVGPVGLAEVRTVLTERLALTAAEPPRDRYGRVFVGTPEQARGRAFRVVFVPGLAERMFPQRPRQDPLLLDALRRRLPGALRVLDDRAADERLLLRLAVGAASERLHLSFPRIDVAQSRPRVPSFYALDVARAITGRVPDYERLSRSAAAGADAWLAWPAPARAEAAIDDAEYDLAVLGTLFRRPTPGDSLADGGPLPLRGRARYLLEVSPTLARSLRAQWARARPRWSECDGLLRVGDGTREALQRQRPSVRPFSVSALQRFAACPYQFLLGALYRLEALEPPEPLERLDPLTKGAMFHETQRDVFRALQARGRLPVSSETVDEALLVVDEALTRVAAFYEDRLAPAIGRVWADEIEALRVDLRTWVRQMSEAMPGWMPAHFELSFGLPLDADHDPSSLREPVVLPGGFKLRGAIDLIETHVEHGTLRVTDHKTGRRRARPHAVIGGGELLQPVIYSLAVEAALGRAVAESRLWYCTTAGEFTVHPVQLDAEARRSGVEALEIVDRAIDTGMFPLAPKAEQTCTWCDFRPVCGPDAARRTARKVSDPTVVGDVAALRAKR